jgi:disulfide bond formation protein DsbB
METDTLSTPRNCIEIRFGLGYSILILIISVLLALIAYVSKSDDKVSKYLIYGMSLLSFIQGIYAVSGGKFIKYDPNVKKLKFYGLFRIMERSIRFDKLTFEGKDLYREVDGKRKYVNLQRYQCNREDIDKFIDSVNLQS